VVKDFNGGPWAARGLVSRDGAAKVWAGSFGIVRGKLSTLLRRKRARICKARWRAAWFFLLTALAWGGGAAMEDADGGGFGRVKPNATDIEILFEAVQWQEIGKLQKLRHCGALHESRAAGNG